MPFLSMLFDQAQAQVRPAFLTLLMIINFRPLRRFLYSFTSRLINKRVLSELPTPNVQSGNSVM